MFQSVINFFGTAPPALDPLFVPWLAALIAGNVIVISGLWALLKYIAKLTPWATDDKIIQIITGAYDAVKGAVSSKELPEKMVAESVDGACDRCGK